MKKLTLQMETEITLTLLALHGLSATSFQILFQVADRKVYRLFGDAEKT